ncbi:MAG: lipoprotein [Pseudomonadota bacterium]
MTGGTLPVTRGALFATALVALALAGCGRKGDPIPPRPADAPSPAAPAATDEGPATE